MTTFPFYQNHKPPTLEEILYSRLQQLGPYSRESFIRYLNEYHCIENLEFVVEIDEYISRLLKVDQETMMDDSQIIENQHLADKWTVIYRLYLHPDGPKEINVPNKFVAKLLPAIVPCPHDLYGIRNLTYELLMTNYKDFLSSVRDTEVERGLQRRKLEMVAPETVCSPQSVVSPNEHVGYIWPASPESSRSSDEGALLPGQNSRSGSSGTIHTRPSSRGSSMGSIIDSFKEHSGIKKTMQILRTRRASLERQEQFIH